MSSNKEIYNSTSQICIAVSMCSDFGQLLSPTAESTTLCPPIQIKGVAQTNVDVRKMHG